MYKIICKNVPGGLLKREAAKSHFRQFGSVKRIVFRTISKVITVEYATEEAAQKAFKYGNVFDNERFSITVESSEASEKMRLKKETSFNLPDDVKAELDAMGGGPSAALARNIVKRPVLKETPKKAVKRHVSEDMEKTVPKKTKPLTFTKKTEYKELLQVMNMCAITVEDKFKVLDARDKVLRMIQKDNGANNGVTRGTCPDMCPEKERLLRVIQHQVSYFEQNSFREMDPRLAVKQYSRSSADQESPLPHELRPVQVLLKTMDYLVQEIIPLGETPNINVGDWFHFVWDRTRGIRKDITQQELCCTFSVFLIEQCARFHIHCSARLVAEDPSVFDQKINTENLTKCLQTLKYMYNDLRLKGVECPNEAEFRAYIILLNLNDGNFMWEVQRLPLEIQQSKEVKTAIQIYRALNSDNFIRFFKLVRDTSYLNACLLMRYFMQVRNRGIDIILKCYTPRIAKAVYPLEVLADSFGFESVRHAAEFVLNCGLQMDDSKSCVKLDRAAFIAQDLNCATLDRSINLVESKRQNSSLATIILGLETLPLFKPVEPHSSFNEAGFLVNSLLPNEDFVEPAVEEVKNVEEIPSEETELKDEAAGVERSSFVPDEDMEASLFSSNKNIFGLQEKISSDSVDTSEKLPTNEEDMEDEPSEEEETSNNQESNFKSSISIFDFFNPSGSANFRYGGGVISRNQRLTEMSKKIPGLSKFTSLMSTFDRISRETEIQRRFSRRKTRIPSCSEPEEEERPFDPYLARVLRRIPSPPPKKESDLDICLKEIEKRRLEEMKRKNEEDREFQMRLDVQSLVLDMVGRVEEEIEDLEYLKVLRSRKESRLGREFFKKWRDIVAKARKQRMVNGIFSFRERTLKEGAAGYSVAPISYIRRRSPKIDDEDSINNLADLRHIDLDKYSKVLGEKYLSFRKKTPIRTPVYWKCVVSLPDRKGMGDFETVNATVQNYFGWEDDETPLIKQKLLGMTPVRLSFVKEIGRADGTNDANGLIFIAERLDSGLYSRVMKKFRNTGILFNVPIVVIVQIRPVDRTHLDKLIEDGIISGYLLLINYKSHGLVNLIEKGLDYLAANANPPPPVGVDHLDSILFRNLLGSELWHRVSCYGKTNPDYGNCLKDPNIVIALYNYGLEKLKNILLDPTCYEYARFPTEFREFEEPNVPCDYKFLPDLSKDQCYKDFVTDLFEKVMPVREFGCWPPTSEAELEKHILNFAKNNFKDNFMEVIRILRAALWKPGKTHMEQIMWTDIMDMIAMQKLKSYKAYVEGKIKSEWKFFDQVLAVYNTDALQDFLESDWFYVDNPIIKSSNVLSYYCSPVKWTECEDTNCCNIQETVDRAKRSLNVNRNVDPGFDISLFNQQLEDVRESIFVSKRINSKFEDFFR